MVVGCGGGSFNEFVSAEFGFFTGLATFLNNEVGNGAAVDFNCLELVDRLAAVCNSEIEKFLGEFNETCVFSNEVGFALESHDSCEVAFVLCQNATFGCHAVLAFGCYSLALLAKDFNCGFDVAVGFSQGFFAVHQAGACEVAQLGDFCHCYCHDYGVFLCS